MVTNEQKKISIEMWSDFMCPLCYIGKTNLENALSEFQHKKDVEIIYRPFQLYPEAPSNTGKNYYEYTSMTHGGLPIEYVRESNKSVIALAKTVGLNYNLDILIPTNTSNALQISLYAQEKGKAREWSSKIYKAYLVEGLDIGAPQMLSKLGSEVGLDVQEILYILNSDKYKSQLQTERSYAESIGIGGTPYFVLNNKIGISGVKSKEDFLNISNQIWVEENQSRELNVVEGRSCDINGKCE